MKPKTKVVAEKDKQELMVTREFDLPLELLFKAYEDPEIVEQWMGTKVLKLENKNHGSWQIETCDTEGNIVFRANGVIHEFSPNRKITRTFEMEDSQFAVQLEFLEFEKLNEDTSKLEMHIVFRSVEQRDQMVQIGMPKGINMAHNQLQKVVERLK
ncbi:MAG: SRPBCC domain-containing protein [Proteobacteria bacterium]|nr:SRPBCC domain-containing protein [Pseudomonadota bacterium]